MHVFFKQVSSCKHMYTVVCLFRSHLETPVRTPHVQKGCVRWLMKVMSASVQRVGMETIVNTVSKQTFFHKTPSRRPSEYDGL